MADALLPSPDNNISLSFILNILKKRGGIELYFTTRTNLDKRVTVSEWTNAGVTEVGVDKCRSDRSWSGQMQE